jgi:adenylate cyclase
MPDPAEQHTFLLADLAGYTALTEAHGDERAADVAADFVHAVRRLLTEYEGEEVKALGDALLLRLASAGDALALARRIVCEVGTSHAALGVRIGVHTGTAVERDGDWFGSAVNVAARVADRAQAGEVMLTAAALAAAGGQVEVLRRDPALLKNVRQPVELYALDLDPHIPQSLVVDPVCRMALDPDQAYSRISLGGHAFSFCSPECAEAFSADPEQYARSVR